MRKISISQIVMFMSLFGLCSVLSCLTAWGILRGMPTGDFRGIALVAAGIFFLYVYSITAYRLLLAVSPLEVGDVGEGSRQEFTYHVYLLFFLILFYPVMRSGLLPIPLMRLFYLALGAKLGANTYSSGVMLDPKFIDIGSNTIVGQNALLVPHVIEGRRLAHYTIKIGSNVTIGAHSVVLAGTTIGDNAIIAMGAVVPKGTQVGAGEVWGGIPAKKIKMARVESPSFAAERELDVVHGIPVAVPSMAEGG